MAARLGLFAVAVISLVDSSLALGSQCSAAGIPTNAAGSFWLEGFKSQGISPLNPDGAYKVKRNVKDFGAVGDGVADDSDAINEALSSGGRCGLGCVESTIVPGLIYFPPGKYLVKKPIVMNWYTQMVGDATNPPTILAAPDFAGGPAIIDADPYLDGGAQYWVNQNNFYRSLRNLVVDMTQLPVESGAWGIHWQVSQATSIYNLRVEASKDPATNHVGMFMENGSGGYMGDMVFNGGKRALDLGNQQFTVRNLEVNDAQVAIYTNWNWVWTFLDTKVNNCGVAFLINTGGNADAQTVGSQNIVDATISNTKIFVQTTTNQPDSLAGSIVIDNAELKGVEIAVADKDGGVLLEGGDKVINQWIQGNVYEGTSNTPKYFRGEATGPTKPESLLDNGKFVGRTRPQYADVSPDDIISVRAEGAKGDGKTDDSDAIQAVFDKYAGCKLIFFDHGIYLVTKTINIPVGTQMTGEAWTQLMAAGDNFADINNPQVAFRVGKPGDVGIVEISDIAFTTRGPSPGAIVVEWNVHEPEGQKGAAGMWDTFIRIGGAEGTNLNSANCLKLQNTGAPECMAAFLGLHITQKASAYIEGLWVWLADHDIDHNNSTQISIFSGRGIYSESAGPVWLIGTGSEHHVLYQYNLVGAEDHFLALIQTESPYFQPQPAAPAPFTPDCQWDDPTDFSSGSAWALRIHDSENVLVYGAGTYSFFDNYAQECIPNHNCQQQINDISSDSENVHIYSLSTVATVNMLSVDGKGVIDEKPNESGFQSTVVYWSQ